MDLKSFIESNQTTLELLNISTMSGIAGFLYCQYVDNARRIPNLDKYQFPSIANTHHYLNDILKPYLIENSSRLFDEDSMIQQVNSIPEKDIDSFIKFYNEYTLERMPDVICHVLNEKFDFENNQIFQESNDLEIATTQQLDQQFGLEFTLKQIESNILINSQLIETEINYNENQFRIPANSFFTIDHVHAIAPIHLNLNYILNQKYEKEIELIKRVILVDIKPVYDRNNIIYSIDIELTNPNNISFYRTIFY